MSACSTTSPGKRPSAPSPLPGRSPHCPHHIPWQTAMGVVVIEGAIIAVLALTRAREAIMNAIPMGLKRAIAVGIGLFITLLGMVNAGLVKANTADAPLTYG